MSSRVTRSSIRGVELGYAAITANVTQTGAGNVDVPGLSVTVTVGSRPIIVQVGASGLANSSASGVGGLQIKESTTVLASMSVILTALTFPVFRSVRLAPSAGSHTYKVNLSQLVTGNATLSAASTDPAFIQVIEI